MAESIEVVVLWLKIAKLFIRLRFNRWAEREQHPLHRDRPELVVTINAIEWELRSLGFEYLI